MKTSGFIICKEIVMLLEIVYVCAPTRGEVYSWGNVLSASVLPKSHLARGHPSCSDIKQAT